MLECRIAVLLYGRFDLLCSWSIDLIGNRPEELPHGRIADKNNVSVMQTLLDVMLGIDMEHTASRLPTSIFSRILRTWGVMKPMTAGLKSAAMVGVEFA